MRVKLKIQVIAAEDNDTYDEGDIITNLQTFLNEGFRPKTSLEIKGDKLIWMEQLGKEEKFSNVELSKPKK